MPTRKRSEVVPLDLFMLLDMCLVSAENKAFLMSARENRTARTYRHRREGPFFVLWLAEIRPTRTSCVPSSSATGKFVIRPLAFFG